MNKEKILEYLAIGLLIIGSVFLITIFVQVFLNLVGNMISTEDQVAAGFLSLIIGAGSFGGGLALLGVFNEK